MKDIPQRFLWIGLLFIVLPVTFGIFEEMHKNELRQKAPFPDHVEIKVVTDRWTGVQYYLDGRGGLTKREVQP